MRIRMMMLMTSCKEVHSKNSFSLLEAMLLSDWLADVYSNDLLSVNKQRKRQQS